MVLRSHCPINFGLEHFGDKWSLLILRDLMFKGKRHYNEFLRSGEGISTSVLGDRLQKLQSAGIISSNADHIKKSRIRYSLTQKGIDLLPLMIEQILWSEQYDEQTEADGEFVRQAKTSRGSLISILRTEMEEAHL